MGPTRNFTVRLCLFLSLSNHLLRIWNVVVWSEFYPKVNQQWRRKKNSTGRSFFKQNIYFNVHFRYFFSCLGSSKFLRRHNTICITERYLSRFSLKFLCHVVGKEQNTNIKEKTWNASEQRNERTNERVFGSFVDLLVADMFSDKYIRNKKI